MIVTGELCPKGHLVNKIYVNPKSGQKVCWDCRYKWRMKGKQRKNAPKGSFTHGVSGYSNANCRCETCSDAWASYLLTKKFGITIIERDLIIKKQGGCAICGGNPIAKRSMHVDHNHITGKVRGVLCHYCNTALGLLKEDRNTIMKMLEYVKS